MRQGPTASPFAFAARTTDRRHAAKAEVLDDDVFDDEEDLEDDPNDDEETRRQKKAKRAKKAKEDEEKDEQEQSDTAARAIRARERSRIRAILVSEPGKANIVMAAHIAFDTTMPRGAAIKALADMPPSSASEAPVTDMTAAGIIAAGNERRGEHALPAPASKPRDASAKRGSPMDATAAAIIAAGKKRRGEA